MSSSSKGQTALKGSSWTGSTRARPTWTWTGIFIEIGADPRVDLARQLGVELNEKDEIKVDTEMRTNVHGVFAAGDVTNASGELKQTITAAAQGAIAATSAYAHAAIHPDACAVHAFGYALG